jgi:hypothetical protein
MEKKFVFLSVFACLLVCGFVAGYKSPSAEYETCKRQAHKRLADALYDDSVTSEQWKQMLKEETNFLLMVAKTK